jgi:hypothetical protein
VKVFCGIDWASDHHDVAIVDDTGTLLAKARIDDTAEGLAGLLQLLAEHGDTAEAPVPVAIETSRGLLVACLRATGRPVYAINPMAAACRGSGSRVQVGTGSCVHLADRQATREASSRAARRFLSR